MQHRPNCGAGQLKIIVAILERAVIQKNRAHLGLDAQPPSRGRPREQGRVSLPESFALSNNCHCGRWLPCRCRWCSALCRNVTASTRVNFETEVRSRAPEMAKDRQTRQPRTHVRWHSALNPPSLAYFDALQTRLAVFSGLFLGRPIAFETPIPAEDA